MDGRSAAVETICIRCAHCHIDPPHVHAVCRAEAVQNRKGVDFVTGQPLWFGPDGGPALRSEPRCDEINEGACPHFMENR